MTETKTDITRLLHAWRAGDAEALAALSTVIYAQLRRMAAQRFAEEPREHTLQPTALVHEAFLRLVDSDVEWQNRAHFFALAALHMRSVLVDHARSRLAAKRGGDAVRVTLDGLAERLPAVESDFLALESALDALGSQDARVAKAIELTYFGGLSNREIAHVLDVSVPTVERCLRFGRAWLRRELAA